MIRFDGETGSSDGVVVHCCVCDFCDFCAVAVCLPFRAPSILSLHCPSSDLAASLVSAIAALMPRRAAGAFSGEQCERF